MSRRPVLWAVLWGVLRDGLIAGGMIGVFIAALMWGSAAV